MLVELLLQCRNDLFDFRGDLFDCREQLLMQVSRLAEGQADRVASLVESMVQSLQQQSRWFDYLPRFRTLRWLR